jgi:hypothetical protein
MYARQSREEQQSGTIDTGSRQRASLDIPLRQQNFLKRRHMLVANSAGETKPSKDKVATTILPAAPTHRRHDLIAWGYRRKESLPLRLTRHLWARFERGLVRKEPHSQAYLARIVF